MRSLSPPPPSCTFFKHTLKVRAGARCTVQSGPTFYATNVAWQDHSENIFHVLLGRKLYRKSCHVCCIVIGRMLPIDIHDMMLPIDIHDMMLPDFSNSNSC